MAHRSRRSIALWLRLLFVVMLALGALAPAVSAQDVGGDSQPLKSPNGLYIVQMAASPLIGYTGGVNGLRAPRTPEGALPDATSPDAQAYEAFLVDQHAQALAAVGGEKVYSYTWTFNGFAARLTPEQAAAMKSQPGVVAVTPDEIVNADTVTTPTMLGLDAASGLWAQLGGPSRAGEGVIIGVIDSGIWPENASFADDGKFRALPRWKGGCSLGEEWDAGDCNMKLIGARYFNAGWGGDAGIDAQRPWEFNSARDYNGHGSHTASTAGGNYGVSMGAEGADFGKGSGMAPRARIAVYKALWSTEDGSTASGTTVDLVAAIEQAVKDGVNVINYSISGSQTSVSDPVAQAYLKAASAGVFVAASAGNSGPTASTVAHNYPWVMTVAAGTHSRDFTSSVTLGNGAVYAGKSLGAGTAMLPLIKSTTAGLPGANADEVRLCFPGTLDPAVVTGKIVQCDRGVNARVDKSLAVKMAGGLGMILTNVSPSSLNADLHYLPTLHTDEVAGAAIKAYIDSAGVAATAQIAPGQKVVVDAPTVAAFSSRGPARAVGGNVLKPDILAPGVDVLAAVSPSVNGRNYDFYSGTSMAAPHIAGIAALLKHRQPAWTPDMIKSAIITTASQKTYAGAAIPGNPTGYGAGHVNPNAAVNPGLVFKLRPQDYTAFLCGQGLMTGNVCAIRNISVHDLNLPSAAVSQLAGSQVIKRSVTNVTNKTATYTASVEGLSGFTVEVTPATITVAPGASANFQVKFTRTTATLNAYTFGAVKWTYGKYVVRMPIALRPVALAAPAEVDGAGTSGSASYQVTFGYTGDFAAKPHGLVEALKSTGSVSTDEVVDFAITIPAGTKLARFSLYDEHTSKPSDLDLEIYNPGGTLVGSSGGGTSAEEVNLTNPAAGVYTARVVGFATDDTPTDFTLFSWAVTADDLGNLTVAAPASATTATKGDITLNWSGLNAGTKYLGIVTYHNVAAPANYDDGRIGSTVVDVATD